MRTITKAFFLVSLLLVVVLVAVAWVSFGDCMGLIRRSYHTIVLGDKNYIDSGVRFRVGGQGTSLLPNGRLAGFTTLRASDCVDVIVWGEDQSSPDQAENEMEKRIRAATSVIEQGPPG